jgi:four helix bundle protein
MRFLPPSSTKKKIESYQDLQVWQKAMDLVIECYRLTQRFPANEQYGLTSQIRRAAVSVPANIAEGFGRWYSKEFVHFLLTTNGSLKEVETHLLISDKLGLLLTSDLQRAMGLSAEIGKMLASLRQKVSQSREERS